MTCGGLCDTCEGCVDCAPMTSPPPSETGPSAEEQADKAIAMWRYEFPSHRISGLAVLRMRIADALLAAKRSAHLEARHKAFNEAHAIVTAAGLGQSQWVIRALFTAAADAILHRRDLEERPEVWDALSLLPGGGR